MDFSIYHIQELIDKRLESRYDKDWKLSDEIRNFLDTKLVFVFDIKGVDNNPAQEVYYLDNSYFNKIYKYKAKKDKEAWSETRMEKIERLHSVKFSTQRKFVEWNIQKDIADNKLFDAWLFSINHSISEKKKENL